MAIEISANSEQDVKEFVKMYLISKGVDERSAEYLADLFAQSDRGKQWATGTPIVPMGNCSVVGLFPG